MTRDPLDIDNRYVYGPYDSFPFPYDTGYPTFTYPKEDDPRVIRMIYSYYRANPTRYEGNSLKSRVAHSMRQKNAQTHMLPYTFRSYISPTPRDMWDYNFWF